MAEQKHGETGFDGAGPLGVGDERVVEIGPIAHGGHCIAHSDGRTLFVRYALPGERVRARVTEVSRKIVRAEAVEVLQASPDRVISPCPVFGPGGCGGCDFQHAGVGAQRALKSQVLADSLRRIGRLDQVEVDALDLSVRELPGAPDGLGWRTRVRWSTAADGTVGLLRHRSHDVVPVQRCLIAAPGVDVPPSEGSAQSHPARLEHVVRGRRWKVAGDAFWQVHPGAPEALVDAVMRLGGPSVGESWWDLYSGAGLFAAFVGEAVGPDGEVDAVESDAEAHRDARRALHDLRQVRLHAADVATWLRTAPGRPDGVVLDPPRAGAGAAVVEEIAERAVERIVYVACDPAALARDVAHLRGRGYQLAAIEGYDAFPMTHHVEAVALLTR
jgi:tRNA/tmRNA/rRNA uracil-C5-methylase (TrmA/RlmC/RlmD family)